MDETEAPTEPDQGLLTEESNAPTRGERPRWALPVALLTVGLLVGGGIGAGVVAAFSDPTRTDAYHALAQKLQNAESKISEVQQAATAVGAAAQQAANDQVQQEAALAQREKDVVARETAVSATENKIAANSIDEGTWTVGVDVAPGTYRASQPVSSDCYWSITKSGTNGADIIRNDIPGAASQQ